MQKRGKDVEKAVMVMQDSVPIEYDGPRTPDIGGSSGTEEMGKAIATALSR